MLPILRAGQQTLINVSNSACMPANHASNSVCIQLVLPILCACQLGFRKASMESLIPSDGRWTGCSHLLGQMLLSCSNEQNWRSQQSTMYRNCGWLDGPLVGLARCTRKHWKLAHSSQGSMRCGLHCYVWHVTIFAMVSWLNTMRPWELSHLKHLGWRQIKIMVMWRQSQWNN